ncbi:hypothetical protein BH11MYX1_BH11MYX1_27700 [soil metagenome]
MSRALAFAVVMACSELVACRKAMPPSPTALVNTPAIDAFRATERAALAAFNTALGQQRANQIDELGLADAIDKNVLPPWRELRARITEATVPEPDRELFTTLDRYIAERQTSWEAYSAALRSPDDAAARPHYAKYHEQTDAATADAQKLGAAFRLLVAPRS